MSYFSASGGLRKSGRDRVENSSGADIFCQLRVPQLFCLVTKVCNCKRNATCGLDQVRVQCYYHTNIYRSRATC